MDLTEKIKALAKMVRRLEQSSGRRVARRNSRLLFIGLLKQIRQELDRTYPAIRKPKPVTLPKEKPTRPKKLRLPFSRTYDHKTATLFARIVGNRYNLPRIVISAEYSTGWTSSQIAIAHVPSVSTNRHKWDSLIREVVSLIHGSYLARYYQNQKAQTTEEVLDLWAKFWSEPIGVTDLELSAQHHDFLEKRNGRRKNDGGLPEPEPGDRAGANSD